MREVDVPDALALAADPEATAARHRLSYSHRKEHDRTIADAKSDATSAHRVEKRIAKLRGGS
ncbi:YdeI/OmpD-associated family protein [Cryobacterium aureum]|uniref:YdeI/OmpD-associated family protein n=1 Tax=Cryobacterium aureum TaxID=995037 RepID=UPI00196A6CF9|nr:YdeI/OmpD-associated family protein [Cryobacterium aureum]